MGLYEGRGSISKGMSELMLRWRQTQEQWQDEVAAQFEEKYIQPIERDLRSAVSAMDHMAGLLSRIRAECGPDRD